MVVRSHRQSRVITLRQQSRIQLKGAGRYGKYYNICSGRMGKLFAQVDFFVISFIAFNGMTDLYGGAVTHHNRSVGQGPSCQYL